MVRFIKRLILVFVILFSIGCIAGGLIFFSEFKQAQAQLGNLPVLMANLQQDPTTFYSLDGEKLYIISSEYRRPAESKDIPKVVKDAVVAAEDVRFYHHKGVDIQSLLRIVAEGLKDRGHFSQGGSTLTMQLAKRLYHGPEKTLRRKVKDMALAVAMEQELTKDQIVTLYLNDVFYGSNAYGIRAAAEVYFGKQLKELDASDAAMLVRCVRRPSSETPFANYKKALENRNVVLKIMHDEKMLNDEQYGHAMREKPKLNPKPPSTGARVLKAPYFVDHVLQVMKRDMPDVYADLDSGGYKIYTTVDTRLEAVAQKAVHDTVERSKSHKVTTGACILIDYKGRILAEVGGVDYRKDQFNVIVNGMRQPGSSFKSFLYSAAIDRGILDENSSVENSLKTYVDAWGTPWTPHNDNGKYSAYASLKTAFAFSYNCAAAHTMEKLTPQVLIDYANTKFGFPERFSAFNSLALGAQEVSPLDMARGYSVFMTGGDRVEPYCIERIIGPDGQVVRKYDPQITPNVMDPRVVNQMRDLQLAVVQSGTATTVVRGKVPNAHGKTGTTSDNKDAWFDGYADGLLCVAWVANQQGTGSKSTYQPMSSRIFGGTTATQIWVPVMQAAYKGYAVPQPDRDVAFNNNNDSHFATEQDTQNQSERDNVNDMAADPAPTTDNNGDTSGTDGTDPTSTTDSGNPPPDNIPPVQPLKPIEKPKPQPPPKKVEYVDVEICADSHELATMYCPETVVRTYVKGTEPKKSCHIHGGH